MKMKSRKGSFTVFVVFIFAGVLVMVYAVIWSAGQQAIDSCSQAAGRLWGRSILAEYDIFLKERYGLFGFYGNEVLTGSKLDFYAGYSFDEKDYIDEGPVSCSLEGYSLTSPEILRNQINEAVVSAAEPEPAESDETDSSYGQRSITSRWIIEGLPSGGKGGGINVLSLISRIQEDISLSSVISNSAENIYVSRFFKDFLNEKNLGNTYFRCETEYIITGRTDDKKARDAVKNNIVLLRNGLNLVYLYACPEKRDAAFAAAELLTPGMAAVTHTLVMETWAYMEALNDMKLLYAGKQVPLIKNDLNWALSLENIMSFLWVDEEGQAHWDRDGNEGSRHVEPQLIEGAEYSDYLKLLVAALPEKTRILRIMDLMQINGKYLYWDGFLLCDYYSGLDYSFYVNGKKHEFKEVY